MLDNSVLHSRILQLYLCILHLRIWQCCNCICAFCIVAIVFAHCSSTWIILILIVAVLTRIVLQLKSFFSIATVMVEAHFGPLLGRYVIVWHVILVNCLNMVFYISISFFDFLFVFFIVSIFFSITTIIIIEAQIGPLLGHTLILFKYVLLYRFFPSSSFSFSLYYSLSLYLHNNHHHHHRGPNWAFIGSLWRTCAPLRCATILYKAKSQNDFFLPWHNWRV